MSNCVDSKLKLGYVKFLVMKTNCNILLDLYLTNYYNICNMYVSDWAGENE